MSLRAESEQAIFRLAIKMSLLTERRSRAVSIGYSLTLTSDL